MQMFAPTPSPPPLVDLQYHLPVMGEKGFQMQLQLADNLDKNTECVQQPLVLVLFLCFVRRCC